MADQKRSAAAKKAAATRKANEAKEAQETEQQSAQEEPREETQADLDAAGDARRDQVRTPGRKGKEPDQVYEPERQELEHADFDHQGAEEQRQAELAAAREEHNRRTGDASRGIPAEVGSN